VLSTWELAVEEVVSSGTDRIIVYEGAEDKLKQLGTGLLEKLGIGGSGWEQEERERFRGAAVPAENQLAPGQATAVEQRRIQPARSRAFEPEGEMEYVELEERREREPLRQRRYLDEDNGPRQERYRDSESSYRDLEPAPEPAPRYRERDRERELDRERDLGLDRYEERERSGDRDRQSPPRYRDPEPEPWRGRDDDQDPLAYETERSAGRRPLEAGPLGAGPLEAGPPEAGPREPANNRPLSYGPPSSRPRDDGPLDVEAEPLDDPW
jgi:hypothetical protein